MARARGGFSAPASQQAGDDSSAADRVRPLKRKVTLFRLLKERVGAHPNIVGVEAPYFDEPPFYVVLQYVDGSDLPSWCEAPPD